MRGVLGKLNHGVDRLLTRPEPNAAGRLGLFRIFYCIFYLWHQHDYRPTDLGYLPPDIHHRPFLVLGLNTPSPSPMFMQAMETGLIFGLVVLMFGLRTRIATALVGVCALIIEAYYVSIDFSHATIFMAGYIPIIMLMVGDWGSTYSIDAVLRKRAGLPTVDPADTSPRFVMPIHCLLVLLCILFFSAGIQKAMPYSTWFTHDNFFGHLFLERRIECATRGLALNPGANLFYEYSLLDVSLRYFVVMWESLFFLTLINRKVRHVFVFSAFIFHAMNSIFLVIAFTGIFVVYPIFFDWHGLAKKLPSLGLNQKINALPWAALFALPLACAAGLAALWTVWTLPQQAISLGGLLYWHTLWYPVPVIAVIGLLWAVYNLLHREKPATPNA